jgi:hypothetical protein
MRYGSRETNGDVFMRKDSPDLLRAGVYKSDSDDREKKFKTHFEKNFSGTNYNPDDIILKNIEADFKIKNMSYDKPNNDQITQKIEIIENFVNSREFNQPKEDEINMINLKMTNYLNEINSITGLHQPYKECSVKALELQVAILNNMVKITQMRINKC